MGLVNWVFGLFAYLNVGSLPGWEMLVRLLIAGALGGAIGLERQWRERDAGLRTYALVALGAAVFTVAGGYAFPGGDPSRIAAQVVSGMGWLGAGVILMRDGKSRGVTTATALWVTGGIGMAVGGGAYALAIVTGIAALMILWPLSRFKKVAQLINVKVTLKLVPDATIDGLLDALEADGVRVTGVTRENGVLKLVLGPDGAGADPTLVSSLLAKMPGVGDFDVHSTESSKTS
jgi:putative Mg2+ transporter-C (MgtC) family protein